MGGCVFSRSKFSRRQMRRSQGPAVRGAPLGGGVESRWTAAARRPLPRMHPCLRRGVRMQWQRASQADRMYRRTAQVAAAAASSVGRAGAAGLRRSCAGRASRTARFAFALSHRRALSGSSFDALAPTAGGHRPPPTVRPASNMSRGGASLCRRSVQVMSRVRLTDERMHRRRPPGQSLNSARTAHAACVCRMAARGGRAWGGRRGE